MPQSQCSRNYLHARYLNDISVSMLCLSIGHRLSVALAHVSILVAFYSAHEARGHPKIHFPTNRDTAFLITDKVVFFFFLEKKNQTHMHLYLF